MSIVRWKIRQAIAQTEENEIHSSLVSQNENGRSEQSKKRKHYVYIKEENISSPNGKINFNVIVLSYQNANVCHHHVIWLVLFIVVL